MFESINRNFMPITVHFNWTIVKKVQPGLIHATVVVWEGGGRHRRKMPARQTIERLTGMETACYVRLPGSRACRPLRMNLVLGSPPTLFWINSLLAYPLFYQW
uniref:Uncharacterized protein n=1 Tax=Sphaerodactylus townsendi TaxID=933632 RepID=A0ACB8FUW0_9SAUR